MEEIKKWIELIHAWIYARIGRMPNAQEAAWLLWRIEETDYRLGRDRKDGQPANEETQAELGLYHDAIWYHAEMAGPLFRLHLRARKKRAAKVLYLKKNK